MVRGKLKAKQWKYRRNFIESFGLNATVDKEGCLLLTELEWLARLNSVTTPARAMGPPAAKAVRRHGNLTGACAGKRRIKIRSRLMTGQSSALF